MAIAMPVEQGQDARPILPRGDDNVWVRAEAKRDRIYQEILALCQEKQIKPLVIRSGPNEYPLWVKLECWTPCGSPYTTHRSSLVISFDVRPRHRFELLMTVAMDVCGRKKTTTGIIDLSGSEIRALVSMVLNHAPKRLQFNVIRQSDLQIWRPKNKVDMLKRDEYAIVSMMLFWFGFILVWIGMQEEEMLAGIGIGVLLLVIGCVVTWLSNRRPRIVWNGGKPTAEPRSLTPYDSWQTVVFGVGAEGGDVRGNFESLLRTVGGDKFKHHLEKIWHWGLDGIEEREQYVVRHGRSLVFVQIYPYGDDLYVGWDAHVNRGVWVEAQLAMGTDADSNLPVAVNTVTAGTQPITEYDIIDANCLAEWVHAQIVKVVKRLLEEKKIDQEIDFKIIRAERNRVLGGSEQQSGSARTKDKFLGKFKRVQ